MKTTLNRIREHRPCSDGWTKLLQYLGKTKADDEPLSLITVIERNGLDDALWCLRAVDGYDREIRLFAIACARDVQHLMRDERSIAALDVVERYAYGDATNDELHDARYAAWSAADAAYAARSAARYAASAAASVADAAWYAAWSAAASAATSAARAATYAAYAARGAARVAIKSKQEQRFREMIAKAEGRL